jgi:hypothetical protein
MGETLAIWWLAVLALKISAVAGALACFYAALLLYPDEQGRIQNKLEDWWIGLADAQQAALSRAAFFMRSVATFATKTLDLVFGDRAISFQSLTVSFFGVVAIVSFLGLVGQGMEPTYLGLTFVCGFLVFLCRRYYFVRVAATVLLIVFVAVGAHSLVSEPSSDQPDVGSFFLETLLILLPACLATVSNVIVLVFTRYFLRRCLQATNGFECISLLVITFCLGGLLFGIPLYFMHQNSIGLATMPHDLAGLVDFGFALLGLALFGGLLFCNVLSGAFVLVLFLIALLLSLHRLLWPLANRILYAIAPSKVRKGLLVAAGSTLMGMAFGNGLPEVMKGIVHSL